MIATHQYKHNDNFKEPEPEIKQSLFPEIETVPLPDKDHNEMTMKKIDHLMKFEIGQSMTVTKRSEWVYVIGMVKKEVGRIFKFVRVLDGLRLKRES